MSNYTKTEWNNGSGPAINEDNLNKIEESISAAVGLNLLSELKAANVSYLKKIRYDGSEWNYYASDTSVADDEFIVESDNGGGRWIRLEAGGSHGSDKIDRAAIEDVELTFPSGTYTANQTVYGASIDAKDGAMFTDTATSLEFPVTTKKMASLKVAYSDEIRRKRSGGAPKIVCYGDSNTRYYEGEEITGGGTERDGPYANSYGQWLDYLAAFEPALYGADITINGFPGQRATYGDSNFTTNVPSTTTVAVIGFGTNDVKLAGTTASDYMDSMKSIVTKALTQSTTPIILGIPWFSDAYGSEGEFSQDKIKVWNAHLKDFCNRSNLHFIDTYNLTRTYGLYFNETTTKRHYSTSATRIIAARIVDAMRSIMVSTEESHRNIKSMSGGLGWLKSHTGYCTINNWKVGGISFSTLELEDGDSITLDGNGRGCVSFYPRANSTVTLSSGLSTVTKVITSSVDKTYNQITRAAIPYQNEGEDYELVITASGGNAYIRTISFTDPLATSSSDYGNITIQKVDAADLPAVGLPNRKYFINELYKEAIYIGGVWFGSEGVTVVGTTAQRDALTSGVEKVAVGYKFYNTDLGTWQRWNGTSW